MRQNPSRRLLESDLDTYPALLLSRSQITAEAQVGQYVRGMNGFERRSSGGLFADAWCLAQQLTDAGVQKADPLLVATSSPIETVLVFLGCMFAGAAPTIVPQRGAFDSAGVVADRVVEIASALPGDARLVGSGASALTHRTPLSAVELGDLRPGGSGARSDLPSVAAGDVAYYQFSSGSTGRPRPIAVTHGALSANVQALIADTGIHPTDTFVSWLPLHHDMGLVVTCLTPLAAGADVYLMSPFEFLRDPLLWIRAISNLRATFSCAPDFALRRVVDHLQGVEVDGIDLTSCRCLFSGAEPVNASTLRAFAGALRSFGFNPNALSPGYGLAESTVYVSTTTPQAEPRRLIVRSRDAVELGSVRILADEPVRLSEAPTDPDLVELVSLGTSEGVPFWIEDRATGAALGPDLCGEIVVGGSSLAAGYVCPDGSLDRFPADGLRTGDIGFIHNGLLYVVDRVKNIIIRNGANYSATALETMLARSLDVPTGQVMVFDSDLRSGHGRVVAVVEAAKRQDPGLLLSALRTCAVALEPTPTELFIVKARSLPRTTSGKKQHGAVRRLLANGQLKVITSHTTAVAQIVRGPAPEAGGIRAKRHSQLMAMVQSAARAQGSNAPVTELSRFAGDLLIDSLALFELAVAVESTFGLTFDDAAIADLKQVRDLLDLVDRLGDRPDRHDQPTARPGTGGLAAVAERFATAVPGVGLVAEEQKQRQILVEGRWLTDLASCNYLGFDLEAEIHAAVAPMIEKWGSHPSWTRAVASPEPYRRLEAELAELVGVGDTVVFPTVTLVHIGVLPRLAGMGGAILLDNAAHHSIQEAAALAHARGATVIRWNHGELGELERGLRATASKTARVIAVDGVYSMSGNLADLRAISALAVEHDAIVYVDDAHGVGVLGGRPTERMPYGYSGGGVVRHTGLSYDRIVYVGGLSKAFSSLAAFVTCTAGHDRRFFEQASTMVFSGPIPVASLATALAGLDLNRERGDETRRRLHRLTRRLTDGLTDAGFELTDHSGFPIVNVELGGLGVVRRALDTLWDAGIVVTPSVFPAAPLQRGGVRFTPTAANTEDEIDLAIDAMRKVRRQLPAGAKTADSSGRELSLAQRER